MREGLTPHHLALMLAQTRMTEDQQDAALREANLAEVQRRGFSIRQVSGSGNTCLFAAAAAHMIRLKERNLLTEDQKAILNRDLQSYTGVADLTIEDPLFSDENFIDGHLLLGIAIRYGILRSTKAGQFRLKLKSDDDMFWGLGKEEEEALLDICPHLLLEKATIVQELDGDCQYSSFVKRDSVELNGLELVTAQHKGESTVFSHLGNRIPDLYPEYSAEDFVNAQHFTAYITSRTEEHDGQRRLIGGGHYFYCRPIGEYPYDRVDSANPDQPGIMKRVVRHGDNSPKFNWYNSYVIDRLKAELQARAHNADAGGAAPAAAPVAHEGSTPCEGLELANVQPRLAHDVDAGGAAPAAAPVAHEGSTPCEGLELANVQPQEKSGFAKLIDWIIAGIKGFFNAFIYVFTLKWADDVLQRWAQAKDAPPPSSPSEMAGPISQPEGQQEGLRSNPR